MIKGIDVSKFQENIDFNRVKADGIKFVIIRAGYGREASQKDSKFEENYKNAKAAGLNVGAYWFSYATTTEDAKREAQTFLTVIKGKTFEMPVYFDLENSYKSDGTPIVNLEALDKSKCTAIARAFLETVEKAGYFVGLYMSKSPLIDYIHENVRNRYAVWVAQYNDTCTYPTGYGIWQYTSNGRISGINGDVDCNYAYKDYPAIIKEKGLNGYKKVTASKPQTYTVKWGDTLSCIARNNNTTINELCRLNSISNPDKIYAGQTIRIK